MTEIDATAADAATLTKSSHSILTIPLELFERIAELSESSDLPSLRLVNRECAAKALQIFLKVRLHIGSQYGER